MLVFAGIAFAQDSPIDKGSYQLGGGISFSNSGGDFYENADGDALTMFEFDPFFNYFITNGLAIGANLDFSNASRGDYKQSGFGIGPQVRYYFNVGQKTETKGSIFPYVGGAFSYASVTSNTGSPGALDVKVTGTEIAFFGGATYMLNGTVGIFGQLEYDMHSFKVTEPVEGESVDGTVFGFFTGFTFFLP
jgi:hypothetical protein